MTDLIHITPLDLVIAAGLLIVPAIISSVLGLGLTKKLGWASFRTVVQLAAVGYLIGIIFDLRHWALVVGLLAVMLVVAAWTAVGQASRSFPGARVSGLGSLAMASTATVFVAIEYVIGVEPWYEPQYLIPLVGMMLGNGLTAVTLGLDGLMEHLVARRQSIEARLAVGASTWTAIQPWIRDALRQSMVPIINTMLIVGIVKLPGMMTGQILSGVAPMQAAAYQILIMFMIAACVALSAIGMCLIAFHQLADEEHRIQWEAIREHDS
ncbi:MAG: iron export ABC transporter permease subunit FetB [Bradymonadaceae bacterium]